jgi:hypothetical protein
MHTQPRMAAPRDAAILEISVTCMQLLFHNPIRIF